jgi:outer membrane protein assembly factor BamB
MFAAAPAWPATGGDWPQILGPDRSGRAAADERLADSWPAAGPKVAWKKTVGSGYAGIAVAEGRAFLFHRQGAKEVLEALDAATGETLWSAGHPTSFRPQVGGGDGPLCVPGVAGGTVITYGAQGVLSAHDAADGKQLWQRRTHEEYAAQEGYFGAGSTPVVIGGLVIVNVGGTKVAGKKADCGVVAFRLDSGEPVWTATAEPASYAAPVAIDVDGAPRVVMVTRYQCLLLDPATGKILWSFPFGMRGPTVNAATPVFGDADHLLVTASYGIGSVYASFDGRGVKPVWDGADSLATQYCTPVVVGTHTYALDGREDGPPGDLKCVDVATGKVTWIEKGFGYGTLLAADGKLIVIRNDGSVKLVKASPKGPEILASARPLTGSVRALPALAGGRLYLRDDKTLVSLDVGK